MRWRHDRRNSVGWLPTADARAGGSERRVRRGRIRMFRAEGAECAETLSPRFLPGSLSPSEARPMSHSAALAVCAKALLAPSHAPPLAPAACPRPPNPSRPTPGGLFSFPNDLFRPRSARGRSLKLRSRPTSPPQASDKPSASPASPHIVQQPSQVPTHPRNSPAALPFLPARRPRPRSAGRPREEPGAQGHAQSRSRCAGDRWAEGAAGGVFGLG